MSSCPRRCVRRFNRTGLIISPVENGYCHLGIQAERDITSVVGLRLYQLNGKLKGTSYFSDFRPLTNHKKGVYYPEVAPSNFSPIIIIGTRIKRSSINPAHTIFQFKVRTPGRSGRKLRFKVDLIGVYDSDDDQTKTLKRRISVLEAKLLAWKREHRDHDSCPPPLQKVTRLGLKSYPKIETFKWDLSLCMDGRGKATESFTTVDEQNKKVIFNSGQLNAPHYERYQKVQDSETAELNAERLEIERVRDESDECKKIVLEFNRKIRRPKDQVDTYSEYLERRAASAEVKQNLQNFHSSILMPYQNVRYHKGAMDDDEMADYLDV